MIYIYKVISIMILILIFLYISHLELIVIKHIEYMRNIYAKKYEL